MQGAIQGDSFDILKAWPRLRTRALTLMAAFVFISLSKITDEKIEVIKPNDTDGVSVQSRCC